jgi:hypothetical protein
LDAMTEQTCDVGGNGWGGDFVCPMGCDVGATEMCLP